MLARMSATTCPKCGPRSDGDLDAIAPKDAYVSLLKDWRTWAVAFGVTALSGMIAGGLGVHTGAVGAGSGVVIAGYMSSRVANLRRCRTCGANVVLP